MNSYLLGSAVIDGFAYSDNAGGNQTIHLEKEFDATVEEAQIEGKWLEFRVYDIYGLGTTKKEQVKSTLEVIVDVVAAVANAIAEAASAFINWMIESLAGLLTSFLSFMEEAMRQMAKTSMPELLVILAALPEDPEDQESFSILVDALFLLSALGPLVEMLIALTFVLVIVDAFLILINFVPGGFIAFLALNVVIEVAMALVFEFVLDAFLQEALINSLWALGAIGAFLWSIYGYLSSSKDKKNWRKIGVKGGTTKVLLWRKYVLPWAALGLFFSALSLIAPGCLGQVALSAVGVLLVAVGWALYARYSGGFKPASKKAQLISLSASSVISGISLAHAVDCG